MINKRKIEAARFIIKFYDLVPRTGGGYPDLDAVANLTMSALKKAYNVTEAKQ